MREYAQAAFARTQATIARRERYEAASRAGAGNNNIEYVRAKCE